MQNWNLVITVSPLHFRQALEQLQLFGQVARTEFLNVLVMQAEDCVGVLDQLQQLPSSLELLSRVVPVTRTFVFQAPEEFERKAREAVSVWVESLPGKRFHVRMHRRGFKGRLSSQEEERLLDQYLEQAVAEAGGDCRVCFDDPDLIIAVETVGQQAGFSLWSREQLERYPLLKLR